MILSPKIKETITHLIESSDLLEPNPRYIENGANVLPLYPSGLGWYGINLQGEVVFTDGEEPLRVLVEENAVLIHVALFQGGRRFPELNELAPVRKANDLTCPECRGSGVHPLAESLDVLCLCGGSGWIPDRK